MARIKTSDYENLPLEKWNTTTFRAYMGAEHEKRFGIPYVTNNFAIEGRWIKSMVDEYGADAVKRFVDRCFETYKPTAKYPGINFGFMYSYLRARFLPQVLTEQAKEVLRAKRTETAQQTEIDEEWF